MAAGKNDSGDRIKGPWSPEEDNQLRELVQQHGARNWSLISKSISGSSGKSCRLRWCNQLSPEVEHLPFTAEEDEVMSAWELVNASQSDDEDLYSYDSDEAASTGDSVSADNLEPVPTEEDDDDNDDDVNVDEDAAPSPDFMTASDIITIQAISVSPAMNFPVSMECNYVDHDYAEEYNVSAGEIVGDSEQDEDEDGDGEEEEISEASGDVADDLPRKCVFEEGACSEQERRSSGNAGSSRLSSVTALSPHGARDLRDVVAEVRDDFEIESGYGKEVAMLLETGKVSYQPSFLKVLSRILYLTAPWLTFMDSSSVPSVMFASRSVKLAKSYFEDVGKEFGAKFGSLSSTLNKLYAWEKRLYKEVKDEELQPKIIALIKRRCK